MLSGSLVAQRVGIVPATPGIPIRGLTPSVRTDSGALRDISRVSQLGGGRVLVNDRVTRRLLAFDSSLATFTVVLDTAGGTSPRYGGLPGVLIPYLGDSALFLDGDAEAFVVIDPSGHVVRTMAPPKADDVMNLLADRNYLGSPAVDAHGRLFYGGSRYRDVSKPARDEQGGLKPYFYLPDSVPILRGDFETRTVDTVAIVRGPAQKMVSSRGTGAPVSIPAFNPVPSTDEWVVLPDGTIAIVRAFDYHVDWVYPDGSRSSSPRMPFDWRRLTLEEKEQMLDSTRKAHADAASKMPQRPPSPIPGQPTFARVPFMTVDPADLPDYYPPIRKGQVYADRDGNVWILPTTSRLTNDGLIFDVVNRHGEVFERVRLPNGRTLAGFGPGGIVFMSSSPGPGRPYLERARIVR